MKTLQRPRIWLALLAGIAGGLLVWLLAPLPSYTAWLPRPTEPGQRFTLDAITSDARFLVTHGSHYDVDEGGIVRVWDRERGLHEASIFFQAPKDYTAAYTFISPDEKQLAVVVRFEADGESAVHLYDLASARLLKEWKAKFDHLVFSPEGKLIVVAERVVRDLESGQELRRFPEAFDDFTLRYSRGQYDGDFAVYTKDHHVRLYSLHTGELQVVHDLVGNHMSITHLSRDGQVITARGWAPGASPWSAATLHVINNASSTVQLVDGRLRLQEERAVSPDGQLLVELGPTKRPAWLEKWWPRNDRSQTLRLIHWTTHNEVGSFGHAVDVTFSPDGKQIAILREDAAIDVYAFPFQTPWGVMAGAALLFAGCSWSVGWLWGRWRRKPQGGSA